MLSHRLQETLTTKFFCSSHLILPKTDGLVDNLIEDEAERETLLAKPTCFIIVGKPVLS